MSSIALAEEDAHAESSQLQLFSSKRSESKLAGGVSLRYNVVKKRRSPEGAKESATVITMKAKTKTVCLISYLLLSIYIFAVAAYLEFLNYRAGGLLPRQEYYNNDPQQGHVKWRYNPAALDLKAVTESDSKNMSEMLAQRENQLHNAVIKLGLPQYPLLALSFVLFILLLLNNNGFTRQNKYAIGFFCFLNCLSLVALIGRSYFGSLGW